jgi:uncharacterized membrane-anchored protein
MKILRYLALILLLSLPLLGMVGRQIHILNEGVEVALEIVPVDPRSLFRGDYVSLNYAISRLNTAELDGDDEFALHDAIHVMLVPDKDLYVATGVFQRPPAPSAGHVMIKGRVSSVSGQQWNRDENKLRSIPIVLSVRYGIESYFVPEGTGLELEKQASSGDVSVLAAVLESGAAAIKGLRMNGSNHYIDPL